MSDPLRLTDPGASAPPELVALVRDLDAPPPLPPEIHLEVRGRLRAPRPGMPTRWIAPGVVAAAAAVAGLVLWTFRPAPEQPAPELVAEAPAEPTSTVSPGPAPLAAGGPEATPPATLQIAIHGGFGDVFVDGRAMGPSPQDVQVEPGRHAVRVRFADGHEVRRFVDAPAGPTQVFFDAPGLEVASDEPDPSGRRRPRSDGPAAEELGTRERPPSEGQDRRRSAADVRAVITSNRASLVRECAPHSTERARVTVRLRIAARGQVESADASGGPPSLAACVERRVRGWTFGAAREATSITVPFVFEPPAPSGVASRGSGALIINTMPWARVFLDGRAVGNTPLRLRDVPAGEHEVRLETGDGSVHRLEVEVRAGETVRIVRQLRAARTRQPRPINPFE